MNPLEVKGYRIADELLSTGYAPGVTPCNCTAACCSEGVWVDILERDRILANKDLIKRYMDSSQTTDESVWFDPEIEADQDFPSGKAVGTSVFNRKCVFLDTRGRCSLQVAASAEGLGRWTLKPTFCILYPICIEDGTVVFDDHLQEEEVCCTVQKDFAVPLFEACHDELVHLLGEDGFETIRHHYRQSSAGVDRTTDSQQEHQ